MFVRQVPPSSARYHYYAEYLMLTLKIHVESITVCTHYYFISFVHLKDRMSIYESIFIHANRYKWNPSIQMAILIQVILVVFSLIFHCRFVIFFIARNHGNLLRFDILSIVSFIYIQISIFQCAFQFEDMMATK